MNPLEQEAARLHIRAAQERAARMVPEMNLRGGGPPMPDGPSPAGWSSRSSMPPPNPGPGGNPPPYTGARPAGWGATPPAPEPAPPGKFAQFRDKVFPSNDGTGKMRLPEVGKAAARAGGALGVAGGAYNTVEGLRKGDALEAGMGALDTAAGVAMFNPVTAPVAGTYLAGRGAYEAGKAGGEWINSKLSDDVREGIGAATNKVLNVFGLGMPADRIQHNADRLDKELGGSLRVSSAPGAGAGASPSIRQPFSDARFSASYDGSPKPGEIRRTGNSYEGRDVKFGAEIVNPRNPGVGVTSLDMREGLRQDLLELGRNAAERSAAPMGGATGINGRTLVDDLVAKHNASKTPDLSQMSPRARANYITQMALAEKNNAVTLRGQDIGAASARYGADTSLRATGMNNAVTREGNRLHYDATMGAKQMEMAAKLRERELYGKSWEGTNDPRVAIARQAAWGLDPSKTISASQEMRASGVAEKTARDDVLEAHSGDGKGGISKERLAQNRAFYSHLADKNMSPQEIDSAMRVMGAYNDDDARKDTLMRRLGITQPRLRASELPQLPPGTTPEITGRGAEWNPTMGVGQGRLRLNVPGEDPRFLNLEPSTSDLAFMEKHMGLKLPAR